MDSPRDRKPIDAKMPGAPVKKPLESGPVDTKFTIACAIYQKLKTGGATDAELAYRLEERLEWRDYSKEEFKKDFLNGVFDVTY
jgi:hypothetical protein